MSTLLQRASRHKRGVAALFFGIMLPLFLGFVAMSVDLSVLAVARGQLSTAADAGALAGARQLADDYRLRGITDLSNQISSASTAATKFVQANSVLRDTPVVVANPSNSATGDIVIGYLDPTSPTATLDTSAASAAKYNAVQVTTSRTSDHGGIVPAYFSRLMGNKGASVKVQSTAIAQNYSVKGYKSVNNSNANLLPIVLDYVTYYAMSGQTPPKGVTLPSPMPTMTDQYTWNPSTGTVTSGSDGVKESMLYPVASGLPGNWGTIKVGVTNNSTQTVGSQIRNGITPSQLATFPNNTIALDSSQSPPSITFEGNPGISAGLKDDLESIIGKPVSLPIYLDTNNLPGDNLAYRVIAFAPVRILSVNFQGSNKYVIIQPALVDDPDAIPDKPLSSWTQGGVVVLHLAR